MTARGVIFDLVAAQSPSYRGRGVARYSTELVRAMVRGHPDMVSAIVLHPELPTPDGLADLTEWLTTEPDWSSASVIHLSSAFEPEVPVRTFWPRAASENHLLTAVTLYDLIPDVFPGWYLEDPGLRRRWRCCREIVRTADAVLTLSKSARQDSIALLGVPPRRAHVIGSGTSPIFRPAPSRPAALKLARKGVKGLKKGFVIYNGAFDRRKNVDRLIEGYAALPQHLIAQHQLVIVCEAPPLTRNHYLVMAEEMGLAGRVLITGFVAEEVLVALHQVADLAVYPSLYEGYGLPVVDALACGTPAIAGDNSSLQEILPRQARFQPEDPWAIAEAMTRGLTDHEFRHQLTTLAAHEPPSWAAGADRAAAGFDEMHHRAAVFSPGWRHRPRLALVALPTPLATALAPLADCDRFAAPSDAAPDVAAPDDGRKQQVDGRAEDRPLVWAAMSRLDAWRGGYDAVVSWAGSMGPPVMSTMEQLASGWPGRGIAVVDRAPVRASRRALSRLERSGLTVLSIEGGTSWDEKARQVVEGARGLKG
jgi:glycosyltransferase involved in cell wall biosynthesis